MIRFVLIMAVVFVLPFLAWRLRAAFTGAGEQPMPIGALSLTGAALALASMITLAALSIEGSDSEGVYRPPSLDDGEIRPGRFEQEEPRSDPDRPSQAR